MTQRAHKALAAIEERLLADEPKENPAPDWQAAERAIYAYAEDYAPAEPMDEEERLVDAMIGLLSDDAFRKALGVDGLPGRSQADEKEEPIAWVHGCHIQGNNVELWLPSCPSCGMPRSKAPALRSREEG